MTIILFLIDTSASMNARTYLGARPTLLDVSKDAVEKFLKLRQRDLASRGDRYMLLTFEENPANIKAGWKENHNVFMTELKNLTANGLTSLGPALKNCFDLLNLNRMQTGIDTYGQGRCPYFFEPAIIIVITDGGKLSNSSNVQEELNLPMHSCVPGSELTKEPFRWDQRLFSLVLRLTGTPPPNDQFVANGNTFLPYDNSPIDAMCEVTGGRSYMVNSQRSLNLCLDSIVSKIQGGVVIHFEKFGPDPPLVPASEQQQPNGITQPPAPQAPQAPAIINLDEQSNGEAKFCITNNNPNSQFKHWHTCRKQIYVQRSAQKGYSVGHWPIPEAFWPDLNAQQLIPRTCHPIIRFTCSNNDPMIIDQLPFDKYEIESCPLTNYILLRKQPHVAWQCFISNSSNTGFYNSKTDLGLPFGYLKASTNLTCVNLYVLPYNYPVLLPLLDELMKVHHGKPSREWKISFDNYLKTMPLYYAQPLKRALQRMSVPNLVQDSMENCLSFHVLNYLKRVKNQAKLEFEKLVAMVGKVVPTHSHIDSIKLISNPYTKRLHDLVLYNENNVDNSNQQPNNNTNNHHSNSRKSSLDKSNPNSNDAQFVKNQKFLQSIRNDLNEFAGFWLRIKDRMKEAKPQCFKNTFDINRNDLIDQISRMKINFLQKNISEIRMYTDEQLHSLPIAQMGNYQEYLKKVQPSLRELEQQPVRQHMFGNPFKFDKKVQMMVDEADIDLMNGGGNNMNKGLKRPLSEPNQGRLLKRKPGPLPKDFVLKRHTSPPVNNSSSITPPMTPPPPSPNSIIPPIGSTNILTTQSITTQTNGNPNGLVMTTGDKLINNHDSLSLDSENTFILNRTNSSLINNSFNQAQPANSIDSFSDNSLSLSNSSLSDLNDSDIESPISITNLMSPSNNNSALSSSPNANSSSLPLISNNQVSSSSQKPLTGLHLLSKQSSMITSPSSNSNSLINLTDDEIQMKKLLFKQIRRPGNNYESLVSSLAKHRNAIVKNYLVLEVINEAKKFKKTSLINLLKSKFPWASYPTNGTI